MVLIVIKQLAAQARVNVSSVHERCSKGPTKQQENSKHL
jgi:hypothetical protein